MIFKSIDNLASQAKMFTKYLNIKTPTRPVDNVVITTKRLQDRNIHIIDGTTMENKGKLILTEIFPSVQKTWYLKVLKIKWFHLLFGRHRDLLPAGILSLGILNNLSTSILVAFWSHSPLLLLFLLLSAH